MHAPPTVRKHVPLQPPQQCWQWRTVDMCASRNLETSILRRATLARVGVLVAPLGADQGASAMARLASWRPQDRRLMADDIAG